ncbi:MAG: 2OG-Fe(II) oxygenase [Pseudomonadota bacterium]
MTGRWTLPPLSPGEFAPMFITPTRANPAFKFNTVAGRYVLLALMPSDPAARSRACAAFDGVRGTFDDQTRAAFFITAEGPETAPDDRLPGQRWMFDRDGAVRARFHVPDDGGAWFLLDPALRVMASAPIDAPDELFARIARLPPVDGYADAPLVAPALIVPRVFDRDLCRRLIARYETEGGAPSGVMRDIGGKTVGVLDGMKSRRDVTIDDGDLRREALASIERNLIPMMRRGLQFQATRIERTIVACYDAGEGGYFRPHRDNTTLGTAHRRFAASINLNAEEFEGGDLRFPEFGRRTYRPPTGGAVVFSCSMQHEATPVTHGRRYAFLPFFYDEAGNEIRERNLALIDNGAVDGQTG